MQNCFRKPAVSISTDNSPVPIRRIIESYSCLVISTWLTIASYAEREK
jgi:hypothetical protein